MNHADVKGHLADYLEGELSLDQRALVDAHLDDCSECAREVDEMQRTIRLLRMLPEPVTPPMMAANVMRRIRAGESEPRFFERIGRMFGNALESSFVLPASALAVASLVIAVVQNPDLFSNVNLAGLTGISTASNADSEAAIELPFVGSLERSNQPRGPMPVARVGRGEAYVPFTIQIGGMFPRQQAVSGVGRAPRVLETRATNVAENQTGPTFQIAPGAIVSLEDFGRHQGGARQASQVQGYVQGSSASDFGSSSGGDPRDEWIARALQNPVDFARYIGSRNLAEQELWVSRLADRAQTRGLMTDLVRALRQSGDSTAAWVADDFAAQVAKAQDGASSAD